MDIIIQSNLDRFSATFQRYSETWVKRGHGNVWQAIESKVLDLNIRLFQAFREHKWGGAGSAQGIARAELDARAADGRGIRVRASLMRQYLGRRGEVRDSVWARRQRLIKGSATRKQIARYDLQSVNRRVKLWQQFVGKELGLRQSGRGYLARSFILGSEPDLSAGGIKFVKNRYGQPIGAVETGENYYRLIGDAAGQAKVDARYGIVNQVLVEAEAYMQQYFRNIQIKEETEAALALPAA